MKRHINFWLVMFLAISLALPIYSMAQTTLPTLTLEDSSGNRISGANVKAFSLGPDNNLVVHLDGPFNFVALLPDISLSSCTSCNITGPAGVTASPGANLSFNVQSSDANAAISLVVHPEAGTSLPPPSSPGTPLTFSWNTGGDPAMPPGSYLAVFQATDGANTSQLVVMIKIGLQYKLTLTPGANGTVSPLGINYYEPGTQVPISATANDGYYFSEWSDGGTGNPRTVTMDQDRTISAAFTQTPPTTYTLTTSVSPAGAGTVSGGGTYNDGVTATVTVLTTTAGYTFSNWSGAATGTNPSAQVVMNGPKSVTANFTPPPLSPPSGGSGSKTNPIFMNKGPNRGMVYYASTATGNPNAASTPLAANSKTWFVVDTAITGKIIKNFSFRTQGFNNVDLVYTKVVQDKAGTTDLSAEVDLPNNTGDTQDTVTNTAPYDFDTMRFLYSIENRGTTAFSPSVWVQFIQ